MRNPIPRRAIEVKKQMRKFKDRCFVCGKIVTCYFQGIGYCQGHYPKPKKESNYGRRILTW